MASSKEYLDFIMDQLSGLEDIRYRAMMGEYILYYRGKIIGGIYDDRFLVKPTKSARFLMPDAPAASVRRRKGNAARGQCGKSRVSSGSSECDV